MTTTCTQHPNYLGASAPTGECPACWALFEGREEKSLTTYADAKETTKDEKRVQRLVDDLRLARRAANSATRRALSAERLRESIFDLTTPRVQVPDWTVERSAASGAPHIAVLVTSDFQWGETIDVDNIDGINEYNVEVAERSYRRLVDRAIDLSFEHLPKNTYSGLVYLRLGDAVSGDIHEELKETNELAAIPATRSVVAAERWGLGQLADAFGRVHVVSVAGNHGRTQRKPPSKRVADNYDTLTAYFLEMLLAGDSRFTWQTPTSTDAVFEMHERKYLATHGDNIGTRGGLGFIGTAAPIMRGMKMTMDEYARRGVTIEQMFLAHFHTSLYLGRSRGWSNGSLAGYSEFARGKRMTPEAAEQWIVYFHPRYGSTCHWPILVRGGDLRGNDPSRPFQEVQ